MEIWVVKERQAGAHGPVEGGGRWACVLLSHCPALPLPVSLEALPLTEVPPPPSSGLLLGKAAIGSLFLKGSFKHTVCSPEIRLCLQRSRKLILAAQGSVLIFADFTHLLLAVYLAVFEHRYGLGLEQQIPWKHLPGVYAWAVVKHRLGAKRKRVSREREMEVLLQSHMERETLSAPMLCPGQCHCPAVLVLVLGERTGYRCSVTSPESWV